MSKRLQIDLAIVAPRTVSKTDPIVVSITKCMSGSRLGWGTKADPFPGTVKIAILERDTWTGGDDVVPKDKKKHPVEDDLVVEFEGKLEPNASKQGADFVLDEAKAAAALAKNAGVSPDRVWLNFEGRAGEPFELCLPRDASEGDESFFLEVSAVITEIPVKTAKEDRVVAVSRVRTPHTVLAVEPLCQCTMASGSNAMDVILDAFHPKAPDKKKLRDRAWSRFMLKRTSDGFFQSVLVDSACSLIVLAMVLRYLRVPDGAGGLVSLYDKVVTPMVEGGTLEAKYAPRELLKDSEAALKVLKGAYPDPQGIRNKAKKAEAQEQRDALEKALAAEGKTVSKDFFGIVFETSEHAEDTETAKAWIRSASISQDSYWPVLLLWYMRQREGIEESYDVKVHEAFKQVVVEKDGTTRVELERLPDGDLVQAAKPRGTATGAYLLKDEGHALPPQSGLLKDFGLTHEEFAITTLQDAWDDKIKAFIDEGLPVIAILSPGIYSKAIGLESTPGHWCLIVGYRTDENGELSFILNDPARGNAPQYDMLREDQLAQLLVDKGLKDTEPPRGSGNNKPRERELQGWNLPIERRKLMTLRKIHVLRPKGWVPDEHRHALLYDGRSKWSEKSGS